MDSSTFQPLLDWLVQHPGLSGAVVFAIAALESLVVVGVLVPGVAFMLGIGTLVGMGLLPLWSTLFWAAAGAVFGDGIGYWLGRHFDTQLRHIWPMTKYPDVISKGEQFFKRHGGISIVFGRFVGPVRSIIPAIAGMMHMRPGYFYFVNILSALAWAPVVILPGAAFGASLGMASDVALRLGIVLVTLFFVIWFIAWSIKRLFGEYLLRLGRRVFLIANTLYRFWPVRTLAGGASVAVVLLTSVLLFVFIEETPQRFPVSSVNWTQSTWQMLPAYRDTKKRDVPLRIQWLGGLDVIKSLLNRDGWHEVPRLKLTNASRWFTPNAKLQDLPLWQTRFNTLEETLMMVAPLPGDDAESEPHWVLLRLWRVTTQAVNTKQTTPLWIGSLSSLKVENWVRDVNFLHEADARQLEWDRLLQFFKRHADVLSLQWVSRTREAVQHPGFLPGDVVLVMPKAQ